MSEITEDNNFSRNKFIYTKINHNIDNSVISIGELCNSMLQVSSLTIIVISWVEFLDPIRPDVNHMATV